MNITTETINGTTYYVMVNRGVQYTIHFTNFGDWAVQSRRLSLGRNNPGTFKYFKTLEILESKVKGLFGISVLLENDSSKQAFPSLSVQA